MDPLELYGGSMAIDEGNRSGVFLSLTKMVGRFGHLHFRGGLERKSHLQKW